ncbi:MAG: cytidylate kinase-like family protein [Acutalibacteraceae bacterium]|nr:cytidylate kinase-like family protein [Clostridia bacterium]MEE3449704.1 cytidylate kinase-like family protein [Acutalibacteraceae bacterium]
MSKKFVVAISRQYGSGGHEIGRKLAKKLDISFYDKELLTKIAKDSGMSEDLVKYYDEMPSKSFLFSLAMDAYPMSFTEMPINQKVYQAQVDTIKKIANEESCVIIGRCADTILSDYENLVTVFIHAGMDAKIKRVMERDELTREKAKDRIIKTDKKRASFYNYYSLEKKWGDAASHDLTIDSSKLGIDETVVMIYDYLKLRGFLS